MKKSIMTKEEFTELLKKLKISQLELSVELGITETTVNKWFKVNKMPLWVERYLKIYEENKENKKNLLKLKEVVDYSKTVF